MQPLNSITDTEYITIAASIEAAYSSQWNCSICLDDLDKRNSKKGDPQKWAMAFRKAKACFDPVKKYRVENIIYKKCIGNYTDQAMKSLIDLFGLYEKGTLPFEGSSMDQPAKVIEIFSTIEFFRDRKVAEIKAQNEAQSGKSR